jgi:predicted glycosyltransferase
MGTGTPEGLCIAIYSQDGLGRGHMQRICSIAWETCRVCAEDSIQAIPDSQFGEFFPISPHHEYIKLSSIAKRGPGNQTQSAAGDYEFPATA